MIMLLTTWISQRIITVTAITVLIVAAVPTTLVIVSHDDHNTIAVVQPVDDKQKVVLVAAVKKAGDAVIVRLNNAESSCATQVTQTVNSSKVAAKLQTQLASARTRLQGSTKSFVAAVQKDEDRFAHLAVVTQQDEDNELAELNLIQIVALGDGHSTGTITITCQTVLVTIQETIQITVIEGTAPTMGDESD
jgi:hypothetical protein